MDYTYEEYGRLVSCLKKNGYRFAIYRNYKDFNRAVIMRHDVDISLDKAVEMAEFEQHGG